MIDDVAYEKHLLEADERAVASFDKATLTLSGGGLVLSITFLNDIAAREPRFLWILFSAWTFWFIAVTVVLISFHTGHKAMRRYLRQSHEERQKEAKKPGGKWSTVTEHLNVAASTSFVVGAVFMAIFAALNV